MDKYVLKYKGKMVSDPDVRSKIDIARFKYIVDNKLLIAHDLTVDLWSEGDSNQICTSYDSTAYDFESCKTKDEVLEMIYFWVSEYKEMDIGIDSWMLRDKLRDIIKIADKLP